MLLVQLHPVPDPPQSTEPQGSAAALGPFSWGQLSWDHPVLESETHPSSLFRITVLQDMFNLKLVQFWPKSALN